MTTFCAERARALRNASFATLLLLCACAGRSDKRATEHESEPSAGAGGLSEPGAGAGASVSEPSARGGGGASSGGDSGKPGEETGGGEGNGVGGVGGAEGIEAGGESGAPGSSDAGHAGAAGESGGAPSPPRVASGTRVCSDSRDCYGLECRANPKQPLRACLAPCQQADDCSANERCVPGYTDEPSCFTRCESPIDCAYLFDCFDVSGNREYTCIPAIWVR